MRVVVVGAGAWGLPTAAELVRRGHAVLLVDRYGPGNLLSSSSGPTRLWRVADPDPVLVRLGRRSAEAMARLESRLGRRVHAETGLLWRDDAAPLDVITGTVAAENVPHTEIPAAEVHRPFPGLRPDHRDALWFPEGGALLAADALAGYTRLFDAGGGEPVFGAEVTTVTSTASGAAVVLSDGRRLDADVAVVCAGPGTPALLPGIGLDVPLRPFLEQVVHLGHPEAPDALDSLPCLFDGPGSGWPGIYTMPTPGVGYKVGIDDPMRELIPGDVDRTPDPARTAEIVARSDALLPDPGREVIDAFVCCWTDSLDGGFVIDRADAVVVACGDSGKGFKYSPVIGEILADLAEGGAPDADVGTLSAGRFEGRDNGVSDWTPTSLGGTQA